MNPLCFVLMPFGKKQFGEIMIDFDEIYNSMIKPAIVKAAMEPIRADEEKTDGIIHKAMFERLVLCEYAVGDLTSANANVFYELGVRHAIKPYSTVLLFAESTRLPFDISFLRALPYSVDKKGKVTGVKKSISQLRKKLEEARKSKSTDSPLFQLLDDYPDIPHEKTDIFRDQVEYSIHLKKQLEEIRNSKLPPDKKRFKLLEFEKGLGNLDNVESGVIVDLFLTYRDVKAYEEMISLADRMPQPLASTIMIREQCGLALNRLEKRKDAEQALTDLIYKKGPSSETLGILGRVYKDQWLEAENQNNELLSRALLRKAIDTYLKGFKSNMHDAYPGINAATLLFIEDPGQAKLKELLPILRFTTNNKIDSRGADYWDYATLFELDILEQQIDSAQNNLELAAGYSPKSWMVETTLNNLEMIRKAREKRNDNVDWLMNFEKQLNGLIE